MLANIVTHVHYHVVPRYGGERNFAETKWVDEKYGHSPMLSCEEKSREILDAVKTRILDNLS